MMKYKDFVYDKNKLIICNPKFKDIEKHGVAKQVEMQKVNKDKKDL